MSHRLLIAATVALGLAVAAPAIVSQANSQNPAMHAVAAADLAYEPIEVPGFASGMKIAPIHGDPSVPDKPYTLRLLFPDGYAFPPHWHPRAENVTVVEGTLQLAMGKEFDTSKLTTYPTGDYLFIAAENPHFGQVQGRTVLQLHGMGPFAISVVEGQEMTE